ncbi:hypothetical protein B0H13DRAFT_2318938 [Mycena leptocephala]|nr:hypothetical protein B0H13DRAFT_2318938 [Mycena leptocephala]
MSIFVERSQVLSVSFQPSNRSALSMRFLDSLPDTSRTNPLLVTTVAGQHHPIYHFLCRSKSILNSMDLRIDSSFDAWRFVSDPTHTILNGSTSPSPSDEHDSVTIDWILPIRAASNPRLSTATSSRIPARTLG